MLAWIGAVRDVLPESVPKALRSQRDVIEVNGCEDVSYVRALR